MTKQIFNPIQADLRDLLQIKSQVAQLFLKETNRKAYVGFGNTRSPFKTKGLDFQEVRVYQPGDDIRQIDWRITAKYGKPFTKLYTDEKERQVFFICDMRSTMKFASQGAFKSVLVARIAAFLAYMAENKKDKIGFTVITDSFIETAQAFSAKEALTGFLKTLEKASYSATTSVSAISLLQAFEQSSPLIKSGALIFILSDFSDWSTQTESFIQRWSVKNTCSFIHIYDALEQQLPEGFFPVSDGVNFTMIDTTNHVFKENFPQLFKKREDTLQSIAKNYKCGYLPIRTDEDALLKTTNYCLEEYYAVRN